MDEATTKKLTEWKIVAKAVQGDKKATHAANSFNCLFYTTPPGEGTRSADRGQPSLILFRSEQNR